MNRRITLRVLRGVLIAGGLAMIGFGVSGLLHDSYITDPLDVLIWAGCAVVLHDGVWLPLVGALGAPLARRPVLRGLLIVAAAVTAVGLPVVLREGMQHGNPSLLPLPYLRNWLLVLAACAALALLVAVALWWQRRRHGRGSPPEPEADQ